jgi:hypothetical protein
VNDSGAVFPLSSAARVSTISARGTSIAVTATRSTHADASANTGSTWRAKRVRIFTISDCTQRRRTRERRCSRSIRG